MLQLNSIIWEKYDLNTFIVTHVQTEQQYDVNLQSYFRLQP